MKIPHLNPADRIKSKSGRWMMVTGIINGSILILLILIPLIYPEALPKAICRLCCRPTATASAAAATATARGNQVVHVQSEMMNNQLTAPTKIPHNINRSPRRKRHRPAFGVAGTEGLGGSGNGVMGSVFGSGSAPKVQAAPPKKVNISAGVVIGMLIQKTHADVSTDRQGGACFRHGRDSGHHLEDRND